MKENKKELELCMYGWVPYNISEIQKGIQFGHAVDQYAREFANDKDYKKWVDDYKTYIILNGGTTNNDRYSKWYGSLNKIVDKLIDNGCKISTFHEPDLGDQLTSVVLLVDERCFNSDDYPSFKTFLSKILNVEAYDKWHNTFGNNNTLDISTQLYLKN
jgi:hypothetical protein